MDLSTITLIITLNFVNAFKNGTLKLLMEAGVECQNSKRYDIHHIWFYPDHLHKHEKDPILLVLEGIIRFLLKCKDK